MNFEYLMELVKNNQFDEVKVIGKTVRSQKCYCHFAAMVRKSEQVYLYVMVQTEPEAWADLASDEVSMRESMKSPLQIGSGLSISKIKINDLFLESNGGQSYVIGTNQQESMIFLASLINAGWSLPKDSVFYDMDFDCIEIIQCRISTPLKKLPDWKDANVCITWGTGARQYNIEKRVNLTVSDESIEKRVNLTVSDESIEKRVNPTVSDENTGNEADTESIAFIVTDEDGRTREAVCYLNRVVLVDPWAEHEKQFADPEYQRLVKERMSKEQFEEMKQSLYRALEQDCPRGKCFLGIEYECTMDVQLQFYSCEYLESKRKEHIHQGSSSVYLSIPKPDKDEGVHGLKLRACLIYTPVSPDTRQMQAELFSAYEIIPERDEILEF